MIKKWKEKCDNPSIALTSPFGTIDFVDSLEERLRLNSRNQVNGITTVTDVLEAYKFLICYLIKLSDERLSRKLSEYNGKQFEAKSQSQVYYLRSLSLAYFEHDATRRFAQFINDDVSCDRLKGVLSKMCLLFGLNQLEKHMATLYEANYFETNGSVLSNMRERILLTCAELKDESVALVDAFAPPDFILNSCLGFSDGRIYEHIFDSLTHNKGAFDKPDWLGDELCSDKLNSVDVDSIQAKL